MPGVFNLGDAELDDFLGQILHESLMLTRLEENLRYTSAKRLMEVWPTRFRKESDALPFVNNPVKLAARVYGGRLGNTQPGDAWAYRGGGLIMVTGKDNFALVERATGLPVVANPDMLRQPKPALQVAIAWWERRIPDEAVGNIQRVTKLVQGGDLGLKHRDQLTDAAGKALA